MWGGLGQMPDLGKLDDFSHLRRDRSPALGASLSTGHCNSNLRDWALQLPRAENGQQLASARGTSSSRRYASLGHTRADAKHAPTQPRQPSAHHADHGCR